MTSEERVARLQADVIQRQKTAARGEADLESAQGRVTAAMAALKDEFGVSSMEEAAKLLVIKQADLDQACVEAEEALKEAGG